MASNLNVAIIGDNELAKTLRSLCLASNSIRLSEHDNSFGETADIVIETTNSDLDRKKIKLQEAERLTRSDALILSSALGVTATQSASWLSYPERLIGFAAFATFDHAELVEIAPGLQTEESYLERAKEFFKLLGKKTETVQDEVGFVFARILAMIINEAAFALMEGTASAVDIDTAMRKGTNYPLGPLEWADAIGIDDVYAVLTGLQREMGEDRYRPAPLLRKMIYAGRLGKKSGRGFYTYSTKEVTS
jgi:3-hydroxybutyryl-CoA dehydrogenase